MHGFDELFFIEFLSGDADYPVDFLHHVDFRSLVIPSSDLHEVVHIVAEQTRKRGHEDAVALALLKFVQTVESRVWLVKLAFLHEFVEMVVREEGGVDALVEHKSEAAFRCEEAKFLIAAALRQLLTDLGGSDCGVAAFPG